MLSKFRGRRRRRGKSALPSGCVWYLGIHLILQDSCVDFRVWHKLISAFAWISDSCQHHIPSFRRNVIISVIVGNAYILTSWESIRNVCFQKYPILSSHIFFPCILQSPSLQPPSSMVPPMTVATNIPAATVTATAVSVIIEAPP